MYTTTRKVKKNQIDRACTEVPGFEALYALMELGKSLSGKSRSMLVNQSRPLAKLSLHFGQVATYLDEDHIKDCF